MAFEFPPVARLPIQLVFSMAFLFYYFKYYLFAAIGTASVLMIGNYFLAKCLAKNESLMLKRKDNRMNLIIEVINNIKIIKLNSWVKYFMEKINTERNRELKYVKRTLLINTVQLFLNFALGPVLIVTTFSVFFL
mmetsp:Transcript_42714/g.50011  ORF Transcript_42714/g.50011 Transcript_42714/m.50011 type:complete len:135 (-) Transcript_42714:457-861(-)